MQKCKDSWKSWATADVFEVKLEELEKVVLKKENCQGIKVN